MKPRGRCGGESVGMSEDDFGGVRGRDPDTDLPLVSQNNVQRHPRRTCCQS
jgi:hypothetical protein